MNFQLSKTVSTNILGLIERILQFIEVHQYLTIQIQYLNERRIFQFFLELQ